MSESSPEKLEFWLRGPVPDVSPHLQPVAHALLQAREEVGAFTQNLPDAKLWERPGGAASVGFHLQHLAGVLDRLLTYARGKPLSEAQFVTFRAEGKPYENASVESLCGDFDAAVDDALELLRNTDDNALLEPREVGRAKLPSNVIGLLFHAAEHTQRHVGQLLVTVKVLQDDSA